MTLGEKLRYLREVEGSLRDLDRAMTQSELVRVLRQELGQTVSQAYLSQVENGKRKHLTDTTRMLLAKFFKVHPGYLVTDPEGFGPEFQSPVRAAESSLDLWLINGAERFSRDPEVSAALLTLARQDDTRSCLMLLAAILQLPDLAPRLTKALRPRPAAEPGTERNPANRTRKTPKRGKSS